MGYTDEPGRAKLDPVNKGLDEPDRIIRSDIIINRFGQPQVGTADPLCWAAARAASGPFQTDAPCHKHTTRRDLRESSGRVLTRSV